MLEELQARCSRWLKLQPFIDHEVPARWLIRPQESTRFPTRRPPPCHANIRIMNAPLSLRAAARQELNAELALLDAAARGLRWLLHIDADELFYPFTSSPPDIPGPDDHVRQAGGAARRHFAALDAAGVGLVTYQASANGPRVHRAQSARLDVYEAQPPGHLRGVAVGFTA